MDEKTMIEKFVCPGCVAGMDTECGKYDPKNHYGTQCGSHVLGTYEFGVGSFALGLPKGFNRPSPIAHPRDGENANRMTIRVWIDGTHPEWDYLNIPVWAMEQDGVLFVRTVSPRIGQIATDIIDGGKISMVPGAIDVGKLDAAAGAARRGEPL